MKNKNVVQAWKDGKSASSSNGKLWTNGYDLYSYAMLIGITYRGTKLSLDGREPFRVSATTANHCRLAGYVSFSIEPELGLGYYMHDRFVFPLWLRFKRDGMNNELDMQYNRNRQVKVADYHE